LEREAPAWPESLVVEKVLPRPVTDSLQLRVTWVGHSTVLVQGSGWAVLTDPMWSERSSPVGWAGPRRSVAPGVGLDSLPPLTAILLSHNHYDHLDLPTLRRLARLGQVPVFAPLGVGELVRDAGFHQVHEMDWWQSRPVGTGLEVVCVPARHGSGRGIFDQGRTLWAGFALKTPQGQVLFLGDTGYGPHLREIGDRLGPFRAALIPIGAYVPRDVMREVHMEPAEALQAAVDTRTQWWLPIHWGTFPLADDRMEQPMEDLHAALEADSVAPRPKVLAIGGETDVP
jgi:L-ascorbate metabolism protein UlaG (beta-lactamase superfamily)